MRRGILWTALALLLIGRMGWTHGRGPEYVPIARLIENLSTAIKKNPKDAESHYLLGRVHYFASVAPEKAPPGTEKQADALGVYPRGSQMSFYSWFGGDAPGKSKAPGPAGYVRTEEAQIAHARAAVTNLSLALTLRDASAPAPKSDEWRYANQAGLYELCLACALEDGAPLSAKIGKIPGVADNWMAAAADTYWLAFERAEAADLKDPPGLMRTLVSEEAGASYRRLVERRRSVTAVEKARFRRIDATLKKLAQRPRAVTPIVLSLTPGASAKTIVRSTKRTRFDLDGTGVRSLDSWPAPETALLVWDPKRTGKVTSGVQLFGSSTFWLFWRDGYAALASLDDNADGWLSGKELSGLALWFDKNQNAITDPGEVIPLEDTPIAALSVRSTGTDGDYLVNFQGVKLKNGSLLPTWDWVAHARA